MGYREIQPSKLGDIRHIQAFARHSPGIRSEQRIEREYGPARRMNGRIVLDEVGKIFF